MPIDTNESVSAHANSIGLGLELGTFMGTDQITVLLPSTDSN